MVATATFHLIADSLRLAASKLDNIGDGQDHGMLPPEACAEALRLIMTAVGNASHDTAGLVRQRQQENAAAAEREFSATVLS